MTKAGVEQTGSYGRGVTDLLHREQIPVIEVNRPCHQSRARNGKTDQLDAYHAAITVAVGEASGPAKQPPPIITAIWMLLTTREGLVTERSRTWLRFRDLQITADPILRETLKPLTPAARLATARSWRAHRSHLDDPLQMAKYVLKQLADHLNELDTRIREHDTHLTRLLTTAAPTLITQPQIGPVTAAHILITLGHHGRVRSADAFAKLIGTAPLPASSGKTRRNRLSRGGDRAANRAIHLIAVRRLRNHTPTTTYIAKKRAEEHTTPEALRSLKRHITRQVFKLATHDLKTLDKL